MADSPVLPSSKRSRRSPGILCVNGSRIQTALKCLLRLLTTSVVFWVMSIKKQVWICVNVHIMCLQVWCILFYFYSLNFRSISTFLVLCTLTYFWEACCDSFWGAPENNGSWSLAHCRILPRRTIYCESIDLIIFMCACYLAESLTCIFNIK